jgi:long-chain acyl-CoA synthetase
MNDQSVKNTNLTLTEVFKESCGKFSGQTALSFTDEPPVTYAELGRQVNHLTGFLRDLGVDKGDRIALLGENSPQWGIAYFAVTTMGAVVVPILPDFHTSEIHHVLRNSGTILL